MVMASCLIQAKEAIIMVIRRNITKVMREVG